MNQETSISTKKSEVSTPDFDVTIEPGRVRIEAKHGKVTHVERINDRIVEGYITDAPASPASEASDGD